MATKSKPKKSPSKKPPSKKPASKKPASKPAPIKAPKPPKGLTDAQAKKFGSLYRALRKEGKTDAYARRVASAEARGKKRQQARGHKEREHVERRQKEGLSAAQSEKIASFYETWYNPYGLPTGGPKASRTSYEDMLEWASLNGMAKFNRYVAAWKQLRRQWDNQGRPTKGRGNYTIDEIETFAFDLDLPDDTWLFYH